jgi:hypothetical protein
MLLPDTSLKQKAIQDAMFGSDPSLPNVEEDSREDAASDAVKSLSLSSTAASVARASRQHLPPIDRPPPAAAAAAADNNHPLSRSKSEGLPALNQPSSSSSSSYLRRTASSASPLSPIDTSIAFTSPQLQVTSLKLSHIFSLKATFVHVSSTCAQSYSNVTTSLCGTHCFAVCHCSAASCCFCRENTIINITISSSSRWH